MKTKLILVAVGFAAGYLLRAKLAKLPILTNVYNAGAAL
jgi:hypothetical protein